MKNEKLMGLFNDEKMKPGKKNRLKIGQKVKLSQNCLDWNASHLSWSYGTPRDDKAYSEKEKEITEKDFQKVYFILHHKLSGKRPVGVVTHYGADFGGLKNVHVTFKFKSSVGTIVFHQYTVESDLAKVKK